MTWRDVTVKEFNTMRNPLVIDVRSPCEHETERIPQSVNVPLLSDQQRAEVGTIYKESGDMVARRHALKLISPKISPIIEEVAGMRKHGQPLVVHCWRGGLRSEAVASVLSIAGIDCLRLSGGYKAWRTALLADFENDAYPFHPVILQGLTGVGKTEVLGQLNLLGEQVCDLESLANHRGSVFGSLGLGGQPSQKNFDAALWTALRSLEKRPVYLEAESRKIGKLALPDCVYKRIVSGPTIHVTGSLERRAQRIVDEYLNPMLDADEQIAGAFGLLDMLVERLGSKKVAEIKALVNADRVVDAVAILLTDYYDPLYSRHVERSAPFALVVNSDDATAAARTIAEWAKSGNFPYTTDMLKKELPLGELRGRTCCGGLGKEET